MAWQTVAQEGEIQSGHPKLVPHGKREIGVFFEAGRYYAALNYCPHFGAPVCLGNVVGLVPNSAAGEALDYDPAKRILRCPWHRWEFELETGRAVAPISQRLKVFPARLDGTNIQVDF